MTSLKSTYSFFISPVLEYLTLQRFKENRIYKNVNYVPREKIEKQVIDFIFDSPNGIRILSSPYGSGKTTLMRHILESLHSKKLIAGGAMLQQKNQMNTANDFNDWMFEQLGLPIHHNKLINQVLPEDSELPFLLVIDDFEKRMNSFNVSYVLNEIANNNKNLILVLVVNAHVFADTIMWWAYPHHSFKVLKLDLHADTTFLRKVIDLADWYAWGGRDQFTEKHFRACLPSQSAGFILDIVRVSPFVYKNNIHELQKDAILYDNEF